MRCDCVEDAAAAGIFEPFAIFLTTGTPSTSQGGGKPQHAATQKAKGGEEEWPRRQEP